MSFSSIYSAGDISLFRLLCAGKLSARVNEKRYLNRNPTYVGQRYKAPSKPENYVWEAPQAMGYVYFSSINMNYINMIICFEHSSIHSAMFFK